MTDMTAQDKRDLSQFLGRTWGVLLTAGIITLILGIVVLVWTDETAVVVGWMLGIYLVVAGIFQLVQSFTGDRTGGVRALLVIGGLLSLVLGVFAFRSVAHSVALLAVVIGVAWLINGVTTLMTAIGDKDLPGRGWAIFSGLIILLGGVIILAWPAPTLYVLFTFFGIWLLIIGCFEIFAAFRMRGEGSRLAAA
jgi:uncharacterized membrane protein HdeD (DUF308 family)